MTSRRTILKAGVALATVSVLAEGWRETRDDSPVLVIASRERAADADLVADRLAAGQRRRVLPEGDDREALLAVVGKHLSGPRQTLVAMASPAMTVLLRMAVRDAGARLVEDRHLATRPILIARS